MNDLTPEQWSELVARLEDLKARQKRISWDEFLFAIGVSVIGGSLLLFITHRVKAVHEFLVGPKN